MRRGRLPARSKRKKWRWKPVGEGSGRGFNPLPADRELARARRGDDMAAAGAGVKTEGDEWLTCGPGH